MVVELVQRLVAYHYGARDIIVDQLRGLELAALEDAPYPGIGSPVKILAHLAGSEAFWLPIFRGEPQPPREALRRTFAGGLDEILAAWAPAEAEMRAFVDQLDEVALRRTVTATFRGTAYTNPVSDVLAHLVVHSAQHRSELAALATRLGRSPGDLDLWVGLAGISPNGEKAG